MRKLSLDALAREQLSLARQRAGRRSATTVFGGHEQALRQTLIALLSGAQLADHDVRGEATVHVLIGRVILAGADASWEARAGDLLIVPQHRHTLSAVEDSVVLFTSVPHAHGP